MTRDRTCESACSFLYLGGDLRQVEGRLGVHQFNYGGSDKTINVELGTQFTQSQIARINRSLEEFKAPRFVLNKMLDSKEMYYFVPSELDQLQTKNDSKELIDNFTKIDNFLERLDDEIKVLITQNKSKKALTAKVETKKPPAVKSSKLAIRKAIQSELKRVGCYVGNIDGIIGDSSERALKKLLKKAEVAYDKRYFDSQEFLNALKESSETNLCG